MYRLIQLPFVTLPGIINYTPPSHLNPIEIDIFETIEKIDGIWHTQNPWISIYRFNNFIITRSGHENGKYLYFYFDRQNTKTKPLQIDSSSIIFEKNNLVYGNSIFKEIWYGNLIAKEPSPKTP